MEKTSTKADYDVVIAGLGPAGATLACLLGQQGLHTLAVDRAAEPYDMPRAIGMDHEVMRLFQQLGIAEDILPNIRQYADSEYRTADGEIIRRFISPEEPWPLSWPPYMTFVQPELERAIRGRARAFECVELRTGCELVAFDDEGDGVNFSLVEVDTGQETSHRARFMVGADGASSFVRKSLGIKFEDLVFDEPWLVVDLLIEPSVTSLPEVNVQFCDPARPHTFVVGPRNLRRFEFMLNPGEIPEEMARPEQVWQLLADWLTPQQAKLWRAATYRFHALVAERWQQGNVFLAGDACHMTPPFLAQGMVQGIKDTANLAWKLSAACRGADPRILETYEVERRPLVHEVISITKSLGRVICERDPAAATERNRRMQDDMASGKGTTVRQSMFPPLCESPFVSVSKSTGTAAGHPSPQPMVRAGENWVRLDEMTGRGFRLLSLSGFQLSERDLALMAEMNIASMTVGPADTPEEATLFADWMKQHAARAILVRPDHMVMAAFDSAEQLTTVLEDLPRLLNSSSRQPN